MLVCNSVLIGDLILLLPSWFHIPPYDSCWWLFSVQVSVITELTKLVFTTWCVNCSKSVLCRETVFALTLLILRVPAVLCELIDIEGVLIMSNEVCEYMPWDTLFMYYL